MKAEVLRRFGTILMAAAMLSGVLTVATDPAAVFAATDPGCTQLGGDDTTGTCEVNAAVAVSGTINVGVPLHLLSGARLDASASGVTLNVVGDMTMDNGAVLEADDDNVATPNTGAKNIILNVTGDLWMAAGSRISANNNIQGGAGGNITIDVNGDMAMFGTAGTDDCRNSPSQGDGLGFYNYGAFGTPDVLYTPSLGAVISAHRYGASASTAGGNINITVGNYGVPPTGSLTMQRCSLIDVSSRGSAGEIDITAGRVANLDGLVLSESGLSGVGANQPRGGGPIDVRAGCALTVSDTGVISSKGQDPGADLVHLKGCEVLINGVVQSTAPAAGHVLPTIPPNQCNNDLAAHPKGPSSGFDGCVRILGRNITIDGSGTHNGNVNVDGIRNPLRGWIDIFATEDVTILGEQATVGTTWAVSANAAGSTNTFAGVVTIKAVGGRVHTEGQAILRANAAGAGSDGGTVTIQAGGSGIGAPGAPDATSNVELNGSFIEANGPSGGTNPAGGVVRIKSFDGSIIGVAPGHIQALGGPNPGNGSITLEECSNVDSYFGTVSAPAALIFENRGVCGGQPTLPADAQLLLNDNAAIWAACEDVPPATKSGHKYEDENANGNQDLPQDANLAGWTIWAIADDGDGQLSDGEVTAAVAANSFYVTDAITGAYEFTLAAGSYFICEEMQAGWSQSSPVSTDADYTAECDDATLADPDLAAVGYYITLDPGEADTGNEFGNFRLATKSGFKFNDLNNDHTWDMPDEPGIEGWTIHLFGTDGQGAGVDLTTTTGADGSYSFTVKPGSYTVCEETRTGWTQTFPEAPAADCTGDTGGGFTPAPLGYAITLTSDESETGNNFGNHQTPGNGTKSGHKYDDVDGDGEQESGEANLAGWKIWAILDDGDGQLEDAEVTAAVAANSFDVTDAGTGAYTFSLAPGKYFICEEAQRPPDTDWTQSSPEVGDTEYTDECDDANLTVADPDLAMAGYYIDLASGEVDTGNEFGNFRPAGGGQGCTPGFWQGGNGSHLWNSVNDPQWTAAGGLGTNPFIHTTLFNSFFAPHPFLNGETVNEMLELVGTGGGDVWAQKTARDVVAAYLNASFGLDYGLTPQQIKDKWAAAVDPVTGSDALLEALHNELDALNNQGCSL